MMNWQQLLSPVRFGKEASVAIEHELARTEFQRDYDRIIFSSPFRRLQNKTQVFPLPGSVFVHNRLTHSLEVASVARSLGNTVAGYLKDNVKIENPDLFNDIGAIVSAASLSHDLGNPPFGHAGEKAISGYFEKGNGNIYKDKVSEQEWADLTNFEGNANALRLLSHRFNGRRNGGFALTYATLASLVKYPFCSVNRTKKGKYGFFKSEEDTFIKIANLTGLKQLDKTAAVFARHPLVYLVEAADDISYQIMDIEDAHKLKILSTAETIELLTGFFDLQNDHTFFCKKAEIFKEVTDTNEQIAFLRASVINLLVHNVADIFIQQHDNILNGELKGSLVDYLTGQAQQAMSVCSTIAYHKIYLHPEVVKIEVTGYNVLNTLVDEFTKAVFDPEAEYSKKLISLLPLQYKGEYQNDYERLRAVIDFISGMTDLYALDLYKLIKGIGF